MRPFNGTSASRNEVAVRSWQPRTSKRLIVHLLKRSAWDTIASKRKPRARPLMLRTSGEFHRMFASRVAKAAAGLRAPAMLALRQRGQVDQRTRVAKLSVSIAIGGDLA